MTRGLGTGRSSSGNCSPGSVEDPIRTSTWTPLSIRIEPPGGHDEHLRPPRPRPACRVLPGVEDAVERRQVVPRQRVVEGRVVFRPRTKIVALARRVDHRAGRGSAGPGARGADLDAILVEHRLGARAPRRRRRGRVEARVRGAESRQRARRHAPAAAGLVAGLAVEVHDRARARPARSRARSSHPLVVPDDRDARQLRSLLVERQHGQERLLRHLDRADLLHPLLALLLLLEQLALAGDVAAVALRRARPCAWP